MDAGDLLEDGRLPVDAPGTSQESPARAELLDECEEQYSLLQQLQSELSLAETDQMVSRVNALAAELKEWEELQPKLLSSNTEVLLAAGKEELSQLNSQLEMVLSYSQAKVDHLKDILQSEQKWVEEKKQVLEAATERVMAMQEEDLSEKRVLQDTKKKIQRVKNYHDNLLETLSDILEEHFPLPHPEGNATKKKKDVLPEQSVDLISLHDMLERLMNRLVETPHDPHVQIDDTFWPPYIEILLRYGIAVRHPEDHSKIRLEAFI